MLKNKILSSIAGSEETLYSDSVFSTYLYTGNGSTQTINNGIDLTGKGGLVWTKSRRTGTNVLQDTVRGITQKLFSETNSAQSPSAPYGVASVSQTGGVWEGDSGVPYVSWTFRRAPKFFDVVTYTGNGVAGRLIPNSLGQAPGMIVVKRTDTASNWIVRHRGDGTTAPRLALNLTVADGGVGTTENGYIGFNTSVNFTVWQGATDISAVNANGATYVAYLFAHDTSADGIVQCGSYIGNGSAAGPVVNLGWEPQWLMIKNASGTGNWQIIDSMRGMSVGSADATLQANLSNAEAEADYVSPTATGFQITSSSSEVNANGQTYIYLAIRRPNKPPKTGAEVYGATLYTGNDYSDPASKVNGPSFPADLLIAPLRNGWRVPFLDRLRGKQFLYSTSTAAETTSKTNLVSWDQSGVTVISDSNYDLNYTTNYVYEFFRRAPGFMDVVCYTGNGVNGRLLNHNLNSSPELILIKMRNYDSPWYVYSKSIPNNRILQLNSPYGSNQWGTADFYWGGANHTSSVFQIGADSYLNANGANYIAYLFASLPGISKVGNYTGNGSSQTINCGFTTGCRFFLVKATSTTGNWWTFDSARGILAASDPALALNSTAAEITSADAVDNDPSGIIVNQEATCNINASGVSYIFLAIS